jgi:hypothetical protein
VNVVSKPPASDGTPWGCLKHVAASRGINYSSARYAAKNGLPHAVIGRAIYVKYEDFDRWLESRLERAS